MRIQLFDRGTPKGKQLFANIETLCKRLLIEQDPEYIKDMSRIYSQGIQGSTVLMIESEVALVDKYPSLKELEVILQDYLK
jgi:hypothetical protein